MSETQAETVETKTETQEPAPAPVADAEKSKSDSQEPKWLPERLERERKSLLKQLGVDKVEDAKSALAKLKELQQQQLTDQEKMKLRIQELETASRDLEQYKESVSQLASAALATLTEEQRSAIVDLAGDSPAQQLKAIDKLRPTWGKSQSQQPAPPANTSPPASAPKSSNQQESSKYQIWRNLQSSNPVAAAAYRLAYADEIVKSKSP